MTGGVIRVWCEAPSHPARRREVFVAEFSRVGRDEWALRTPDATSGEWQHLDDQEGSSVTVSPFARLVEAGPVRSPEELTTADRQRYVLMCRKCRKPQTFRAERLWPILDQLDTAGIDRVSLAGLATIPT